MRVRLLRASVVAVLLIGVIAVVTATLVSVGRLDDVGYPDSSTLLIIREFVRTGHMYLGVHSPPYLVTLYGPLTYAFLSLPYRVAEAVGASPTVAIRLTLVAGVLMCAAMVYSLSRRLNRPSSVAWLCVLFALAVPALAAWTLQVRPDFFGLGFALLGLYFFSGSNGHRLPIAAVLCVGLALLFKQTYVAAPAAIFVYLLYRRRWPEAAFWSVGVAAVVAVGYLLTLWREPMMLEHLAALREPAFEFRGALAIFLGAIAVPVVPFAIAGGVAEFRNGGEAGRLLVLYCVLAWLVAMAAIPQVGGNINYFWEPLFASAVLAGPGLSVIQRNRSRLQTVVGAIAVALLFALTLAQDLTVLRGAYSQWRDQTRARANWELLASIVSGRRLLSTLPAITMLSVSPEMPDPYLNAVLERHGRWSSAPVVADLEAARYDLILEQGQYQTIFSGGGDWYRGVRFWDDRMRTALMNAYEPVCAFDGKHLWLPRHRPRDPDLLRLCATY
jgi:hypothetical protein